jgi:predicted DNA binding protein
VTPGFGVAGLPEGLAEITIRVPRPICPLSGELGGEIKIEDIRSHGDRVAHLITFPRDRLREARRVAAKQGGTLKDVVVEGERATGWFLSNGCEACKPLASRGAFLIRGRLEKDTMVYSFILSRGEIYQRVFEELKANKVEFTVERVAGFKTNRIITSNQEMALYIALKMGLFDHPRRISIKELAQMMGVKPSSLAESLKRGIRRLLEHHFSFRV